MSLIYCLFDSRFLQKRIPKVIPKTILKALRITRKLERVQKRQLLTINLFLSSKLDKFLLSY